MPRLPQPGADEGTWGEVLNNFLMQAHTATGSLKTDAVTTSTISDESIDENKLSSAVQTKLNAVSASPSLGGDLSGTASNAQIIASAVGTTELANGAVIEAKLSSAVQTKLNAAPVDPTLGGDLSGTASNAQIVASAVGTAQIANGAVGTTQLADDAVDTTQLANGAVIETKLSSAVQTKLNAASGNPSLGGDLSGTASNAQIVASAVGTAQIANSAVDTAQLANGAVIETKLSSAVQTKLNTPPSSTPADGSINPVKLNADTPVTGELLSYNGSGFEWITAPAAGGGGEVNTASNVGTGGVGIYKQKTGSDLELKNIAAASSKVTVTNNPTNNTVDLNVNEASFSLTKAQVGLANVDNTSDASKPVSTAQLAAIDAVKARATHTGTQSQSTVTNLVSDLASKAPLASPAFTGTPTGITKAHVGLGNVDDTSDASKPISSATATALAGKAATVHSHAIADLPAGSVVSTSTTTRPTSRTDITVIWKGATDPGASALSGDIWLGA